MAASSYLKFIKLEEKIVNNVWGIYEVRTAKKVRFSTPFSCTMNNVTTCSSTDNFLSPILVSDWLILCCGNSIVHQKKFVEKNFVEKCQGMICRYKVAFFIMNSPH